MATFNANTDLATQFLTGTKVWAGAASQTAYVANDPIIISSGFTVTGDDCHIVTDRIGTHGATSTAGTFVLTNSAMDMFNTGGGPSIGGSNALSCTFTDVKHLFSTQSYSFMGNFHGRVTNPTYIWNGFQVEGDVDIGTARCFLNWFTGAINRTNSQFNNVSFWNNQAGAAAKGGTWQTTTGTIYNNTLVGPFGTEFNNITNFRLLARFANQGDTAITQTNHAGLATNYDFRSLGQITTAAVTNAASYHWAIDVDTGGHIYFINWLPGRPEVSANFGFANIFNSDAAGVGGQAHVCIGTNPVVGTGYHALTFDSATVNNTGNAGVFVQSAGWDVNTLPTYRTNDLNAATGRVITDYTDATGAIIFRDQHYDQSTQNTNSGFQTIGGYTSRLQTIADMTAKSYRKYSWTQQPSDTTFGKLVTVTPPVFNETDVQIAGRRTGGYDIFNGTTWETTTDISDPVDPIITESGHVLFDTLTFGTLGIGGTPTTAGQTHTLADLVAMVKGYLLIEARTALDTLNTRIPLGYTISGSDVNFGNANIMLSATASAVSMSETAGVRSWVLPIGQLETSASLSSLSTTGLVTGGGRDNINTSAVINDSVSPELTFRNFPAGARVSIYDITSGSPTATNVAANRFFDQVGTAVNGRYHGGSTGFPANWRTRIVRVVISAPMVNLSVRDINLSTSTTAAEILFDYNSLSANANLSPAVSITGTLTPAVFDDTSTGSTGTKLRVTATQIQLGNTPTNRLLQELRGTTPYNDIVAIRNLTTDFIRGIGTNTTQVDVRYFKMSTTDVDQFVSAVTDALNSAGVQQSGPGDVFSEQVTGTVTVGANPPVTATLTVQNRDAPTGISSDAFSTGLSNLGTDISVELGGVIEAAVEPLY